MSLDLCHEADTDAVAAGAVADRDDIVDIEEHVVREVLIVSGR